MRFGTPSLPVLEFWVLIGLLAGVVEFHSLCWFDTVILWPPASLRACAVLAWTYFFHICTDACMIFAAGHS